MKPMAMNRAARMSYWFRQESLGWCPSKEGCEATADGQNKPIVAWFPDDLDGGRKPVFRRPARQRERRPAERVEGVRKADHPFAECGVADADRRSHHRERRRHQEIELVE